MPPFGKRRGRDGPQGRGAKPLAGGRRPPETVRRTVCPAGRMPALRALRRQNDCKMRGPVL